MRNPLPAREMTILKHIVANQTQWQYWRYVETTDAKAILSFSEWLNAVTQSNAIAQS